MAVALLCYIVQQWHFYGATVLFVIGLVMVVTGALHIFASIEFAYLYILPVIFASVLLGQVMLFSVTVSVSVIMVLFGWLDQDFGLVMFFMPVMIVVLTALALFISTSNLQTALVWALNGYRQAHSNELLAREHKARLEQALQNLDKAMAKLQRTNQRLTEVSKQAEEARKLKQQFAQTISHELRTPLNLIVGFTDTMLKSPEYYGGQLSPGYLRDLSVVYRNACHLQNLVNDVLDLARLESAYISLEAEQLDIVVMIEDAVNTARALVERRGLVLKTHIAPDLPLVWGDTVRLKQVLLNLLNNAARFTESGSVLVSAFSRDDEVIVAVQDTGIGIPDDNLMQVFESFRQLENPMQRRNEGAGLGLAICKELIDLHSGRIWVESALGVGSTFFFSLPIRPGEPVSEDRPLDLVEAEASMLATQEKRVVLIVTRSPSSAAFLSRFLAEFRTMIVANLEQAQVAVRQVLPAAVIIDTSTENLKSIQPDELAAVFNVPNMTIITCPLPGEEPLRKRLAADGYMIRPITRDDLWDMLRQFNTDNNTVLVVDNDQDFMRLIGRMLSEPMKRYSVTYAYSGREALEMIKHNPPGILLLDLNLSDIDGAYVISQIRSNPRFDSMCIIVITAYEEIDMVTILRGTATVTKGAGLRPNEIAQWIQSGLEIA
ncbi:MAG: response regulator [Anaerolineae bacterium]|nr:response regulator [Anaerolineae bacterium]